MKRTFKTILVILVPIIVMAFFESSAFGQDWTAVQKEIWELEEARWKALSKRRDTPYIIEVTFTSLSFL